MRGNSDLHDLILHEGQVTSLSVPFWIRPGFAIPLIQSRLSSNVTYVQRVDSQRRIVGFDLFRTQSRTIPIKQPLLTSMGGPELFALIDPHGHPHVGPQNALAPIVREWVNGIKHPLIRMSFARFCESEVLATRSAVEALQAKTSELRSGVRATQWFVRAVVLAELFDALKYENNPARTSSHEDIYKNALVSIQVSEKKLSVELPEAFLSKAKHNRKLDSLVAFVRTVLGRDLDLRAKIEPQLADRPELPSDAADIIIAEIKQHSRQEQRIAQLIKHALENPSSGSHLLGKYSDHTAYMRFALDFLRSRMKSWSNQDALQNEVAAILPTLISNAYPRQAGRLLLALALALKSFRAPARTLRDRTMKSRSQSVKPLQREIVKLLDEA